MKDNYYVGVGVALGVAFGAAFDNVGMGLAVGIAIGASWSAVLHKKNQGKDVSDVDDQSEIEST